MDRPKLGEYELKLFEQFKELMQAGGMQLGSGESTSMPGKSMQPAHLKENECQNDDSSVSDMSVKSNHSDVSSLGGNLTPEHADSERQSADSGEEVAADKTGKESARPKPNVQVEKDDKYPVDMYFSKDNNPAKMKFHYILRKSAAEANDAYGYKTMSQLTPDEKIHIHKQVVKECPELEKEGFRIDKVLAKTLIQAKHYRIKCELKSGIKKGDSSTVVAEQSKSNPRKTKAGERGKKKKKVKSSTQTPKMSVYEKGLVPQQLANKAMLAAVKDFIPSQLAKFKPGDPVHIMQKKDRIACGTFIRTVDEMYSEIAFDVHLYDDPQIELDTINLPSPVKAVEMSGRPEKLYFHDLEKHDLFMWKTEKVQQISEDPGESSRSSGRRTVKPPERLM